jgi:SAM-dependent methyltransferase
VSDGSWSWDETLYAGSASYYVAGRLPYPEALVHAFQRALGLDGTQRLLDVGCGPGSLTLLLAPVVASAIGIDADPEMLAEARRAAQRAGVSNVSWRHLRAEALPADLGRLDIVTFAQSFHWMDRATVAAAVRGMLDPGGALVQVQATTHRGDASEDPLPLPRPPYDAMRQLVGAYLGSVRRAGRGSLPAGKPPDETEILRAAGFQGPDRIEVRSGELVTRSVDELVAATFSLSSSTPYLFGERQVSFERELRSLLAEASPEARFAERTRGIALDIWRLPRLT